MNSGHAQSDGKKTVSCVTQSRRVVLHKYCDCTFSHTTMCPLLFQSNCNTQYDTNLERVQIDEVYLIETRGKDEVEISSLLTNVYGNNQST